MQTFDPLRYISWPTEKYKCVNSLFESNDFQKKVYTFYLYGKIIKSGLAKYCQKTYQKYLQDITRNGVEALSILLPLIFCNELNPWYIYQQPMDPQLRTHALQNDRGALQAAPIEQASLKHNTKFFLHARPFR